MQNKTKGEFFNDMKKFKVNTDIDKIQSVNRTVRLKAEYFDKLTLLSEETGVSFNKIINQCIEYALQNMDDDETSDE